MPWTFIVSIVLRAFENSDIVYEFPLAAKGIVKIDGMKALREFFFSVLSNKYDDHICGFVSLPCGPIENSSVDAVFFCSN